MHSRKIEVKAEDPVKDKIIEPGQERSILHQQQEKDYLGRSYMYVPTDLDIQLDKDPGSFECYAPKRIIHTWTGHSKGVNAIRFFPKSGHMLLSASQDCRIKVNFSSRFILISILVMGRVSKQKMSANISWS